MLGCRVVCDESPATKREGFHDPPKAGRLTPCRPTLVALLSSLLLLFVIDHKSDALHMMPIRLSGLSMATPLRQPILRNYISADEGFPVHLRILATHYSRRSISASTAGRPHLISTWLTMILLGILGHYIRT